MNFLLPLLVGGPDMAEINFQFSLFFTNMKSICIFIYTSFYISVYCLSIYSEGRKESGVSKNEDFHKDLLNKNNTDLNSYLAGLFSASVLNTCFKVKTLGLISKYFFWFYLSLLSLFIMIKLDLIQISTIYSFLCYFNYCSVTPVLLNSVPVLHKKSRKGIVKQNSTCTDLVV